jgi:hypothetical protein
MAVRHPPCRVAGRLTPRPIIYSSSHSALLLACESNLHPRKEGNISQPRSGVSARCLSTYSVHPCPPHAANQGRGRPLTMLMHSRPVAMPSRDVAVHPTLAHTDTATVTYLCQLDLLHPSRATLAFTRPPVVGVGVLQVNTRLPHLLPSALRPVCLFLRWLHDSCSLHIPLLRYPSIPPQLLLHMHAARLIAHLISRRDYISDLRGPACCIITYIVHGSAVAAASVACISSSWDLITWEL